MSSIGGGGGSRTWTGPYPSAASLPTPPPTGHGTAAIVEVAGGPDELWEFDSDSGAWVRMTSGGGGGDVSGPAIAVDGETVVFDGTTGKLVKAGPSNAMTAQGEPVGFPNRTDSAVSFTDGTLTFQIAPTGVSFEVWVKGKRFLKTAPETAVITDTEGSWVFYYDDTGALQSAHSTYTDYSQYAPVAYLYWDATNKTAIHFADERHGTTMDWATHRYEHDVEGMRYASGLELTAKTTPIPGTGNNDADAEIEIADGVVYDEDLVVAITDGGGGSYDQDLRPIAQIPVFYRTGASGVWRMKAANDFPLYENVGSRPSWNDPSGPWSLPQVTDGYFFNVWIVATNGVGSPVIALLGQAEHPFLANAIAEGIDTMDLGDIPIQEATPIFQLVFEANQTFTNWVKARLRQVVDQRSGHNFIMGRSSPNCHPATAIAVAVSTFNNALTPDDNTVQKALDTLDDAVPVGLAKETPGERFLGSLFDYPSAGGMTDGDVQYSRVWLIQGLKIDRIRYFVNSGGTPSRYVQCGLYNQTDPQDESLDPNARVAITSIHDTVGTDGTYRDINLTALYTVPATGYYWIAIVTTSNSIAFPVSAVVRENFAPVRRQSLGGSWEGTGLPATASGLSNPASAVVYVAALEQ